MLVEERRENVNTVLQTNERSVCEKSKRLGYLTIKRTFDICASVVAMAILAIPMLVVAAIIKLDSPGPIIFQQKRMGKNGEIFTIYKFRTMRLNTPSDVPAQVFSDADCYITKVGAFLRRSSIDEFPQLWNILKGDMSFVGYRPVCLTEADLNELRRDRGVFQVRPGLTGYAQVMGRDNISHRQKADLDGYYVENMSLQLDLLCLVKTVGIVLSGEGAN